MRDLFATEFARAPRLRQAATFAGHETFVFRHAWLKKAFDATLENPGVFASEGAMVLLGVGKNMVRSMRHWALACGVLEEAPKSRGAFLRSTELGRLLFGEGGKDPYLEDANSLWLLHWRLANNEAKNATGTWAFNLLRGTEFSHSSLAATLNAEAQRRGLRSPNEHSLKRDIECFIRTYCPSRGSRKGVVEDSLDCPLVELELLEQEPRTDIYRFQRGLHPELAIELFIFALLEFWEATTPARETMSFNEVAYGFGSPGMVFKIDEDTLVERLERLEHETRGALAYTETAGVKQIYRRTRVRPASFLEKYFDSAIDGALIGA